MALKEYDKKPTFLSKNRQVLSDIDAVINWELIEKIVLENYPAGQSECGNKVYPTLMLMKAILIQKWFGIKSDPDLACQINAAHTETEIQRNKGISKVRYKIEQYFRITHKYHGAGKARFTTMLDIIT